MKQASVDPTIPAIREKAATAQYQMWYYTKGNQIIVYTLVNGAEQETPMGTYYIEDGKLVADHGNKRWKNVVAKEFDIVITNGTWKRRRYCCSRPIYPTQHTPPGYPPKGYLNTLGIHSKQADLGIDVFIPSFCRAGIEAIFDVTEESIVHLNENIKTHIPTTIQVYWNHR